jgi:hypothetical protein
MKLKYKILLFSILGMLYINNTLAQGELDFNSDKSNLKRILLIPFDPNIYFNDATEIIAKKDNLTHDQIMNYFREEFNRQLYYSMMDSCIITDLMVRSTASTRETEDDLSTVYSSISYRLEFAMQTPPENDERKKKKSKRKEEKEEERRKEELYQSRTRIEMGELVGNKQTVEDKYLHIVFHNPEVLEEIAKRRNIDYFLFINQFEIKGNYENPYMSGDPNASRTLKVHFSLFNSYGELVHGGFGENKIPFYLDDKKEIVNRYFPEVIRQIMRNIDF